MARMSLGNYIRSSSDAVDVLDLTITLMTHDLDSLSLVTKLMSETQQ